jgi:putative ABC transport system permease protein
MTLSKLRPLIGMMDIYYQQALFALRDNRLRTLLSISGVTIGIAAVMVVASVSKGGRSHIYSELETFGLTSLWVYRDYEDKDPHRAVRSGTGIDTDDYLAIRAGCCSAVKRISPIVSVRGWRILVQAGNRYSNSQMQGVGADYTAINNDAPERGRFFRDEDVTRNREVVIIGAETQADLFGEYQNPVGKDIRIGGRKFTVIGVLKAKSRDFLASIGSSGGQNANKRILIPFTTLQQMFVNGSKDIMVLQGEAVGLSSAETAAAQIKSILGRRHVNRYAYRSETMAQYITSANKILQGVTIIGIIAASVSLFVGGMGIMNIMSTSVVERTREIGLRKAIGAHRREILFQFLFEAMLISGIGGILGLALGTLIGYLMVIITGLPLAASWGMALIALFVSIGVGLISGYYPAYRAASLRPVEALRHE